MFKFSKTLDGTKIRRKDFSSEEAYLGAIFDANRVKISEALPGFSREEFIANVQTNKEYLGSTVSKALSTLGKSVSFTPEAERFGDNVMKSLKSYGKYQQFREMTKDEKGHYTRYDPTQMRYDRDTNSYTYGGKVQIFFDESPKDVVLRQLAA